MEQNVQKYPKCTNIHYTSWYGAKKNKNIPIPQKPQMPKIPQIPVDMEQNTHLQNLQLAPPLLWCSPWPPQSRRKEIVNYCQQLRQIKEPAIFCEKNTVFIRNTYHADHDGDNDKDTRTCIASLLSMSLSKQQNSMKFSSIIQYLDINIWNPSKVCEIFLRRIWSSSLFSPQIIGKVKWTDFVNNMKFSNPVVVQDAVERAFGCQSF